MTDSIYIIVGTIILVLLGLVYRDLKGNLLTLVTVGVLAALVVVVTMVLVGHIGSFTG